MLLDFSGSVKISLIPTVTLSDAWYPSFWSIPPLVLNRSERTQLTPKSWGKCHRPRFRFFRTGMCLENKSGFGSLSNGWKDRLLQMSPHHQEANWLGPYYVSVTWVDFTLPVLLQWLLFGQFDWKPHRPRGLSLLRWFAEITGFSSIAFASQPAQQQERGTNALFCHQVSAYASASPLFGSAQKDAFSVSIKLMGEVRRGILLTYSLRLMQIIMAHQSSHSANQRKSLGGYLDFHRVV